MSFREKSAWACLLSIVVVYVPYFVLVFQWPMAYVGLFGLAAVVLAVLLTVFHLVNAMMTSSIRQTGGVPPLDELDRMIELRASKLSGVVLGVVVMLWSMAAMYGAPAIAVSQVGRADASPGFVVPVIMALTGVHVLFFGFVVANLAYYGGIIAGYRRLAHG